MQKPLGDLELQQIRLQDGTPQQDDDLPCISAYVLLKEELYVIGSTTPYVFIIACVEQVGNE